MTCRAGEPAKADLAPLKFWGGFKGDPLSEDSVRLICLAKKN